MSREGTCAGAKSTDVGTRCNWRFFFDDEGPELDDWNGKMVGHERMNVELEQPGLSAAQPQHKGE